MNEQLDDLDQAEPGSLLAADDYLVSYRLTHLWNFSNASVIDCEGCGTGVRTARGGEGRRRWCERCLPIATDMSLIRSAGKKFAKYGLADAVAATEKALADLRTTMLANRDPMS